MDKEVNEVRQIAEQALNHPINQVKRIGSNSLHPERIMVEVERPNERHVAKNIYTNGNLVPFLAAGYVPASVGETHAWFVPIGVGLDLDGY